MLRQKELAFVKAISTLQLSRALLKELKLAMSRGKKKPVVPAGSRSITSGSWARAPQRRSGQLAGKRKANELANSGDSSETQTGAAPGAGSAHLPAISSFTGEQAAVGSRQLGPPEGGASYAAVLAGPVAQCEPSGSLTPTAIDSDLSESAVSPETAKRRMSSDMFGPRSDKPNGTTTNAQLTNTCLAAGQRANKTPIFITGMTPVLSWPDCGRLALAA
jgi:hypothetical protein